MKVLVAYSQQFLREDLSKIKIDFKLSRMFVDVTSREDLLDQFDRFNEVPNYLEYMVDLKDKERVIPGEKKMLWYLPENNNPYINEKIEGTCAV